MDETANTVETSPKAVSPISSSPSSKFEAYGFKKQTKNEIGSRPQRNLVESSSPERQSLNQELNDSNASKNNLKVNREISLFFSFQ